MLRKHAIKVIIDMDIITSHFIITSEKLLRANISLEAMLQLIKFITCDNRVDDAINIQFLKN